MDDVRLVDMHCHLDFMSNAVEVAVDAAAQGLAILATTVTPDGFERAAADLAAAGNVRVGVGLHPWWVADGRCGAREIEAAASLAYESRFVGEIGIDFSSAHAPVDSFGLQKEAFRQIAAACTEGSRDNGSKLLSIHSVRSASAVLDTLGETGCLANCHCIFHWFSGTSDELHRAVQAGCWFSVNEMMLRTRRGREYARQIPADKLLLETDLPPGENVPFLAAHIVTSLERTLGQLQTIRGTDVRALTTKNACELLGM